MRVASHVFCIIEWILTTIFGVIFLAIGRIKQVTYYGYQLYNTYSYTTQVQEAYPFWYWIIFGVYVVVGLILLCSRPAMLDADDRIICGLLSILFLSFIGGLLTFFIPRDYRRPSMSYSSYVQKTRKRARLLVDVHGDMEIFREGSVGQIVRYTDGDPLVEIVMDNCIGQSETIYVGKKDIEIIDS